MRLSVRSSFLVLAMFCLPASADELAERAAIREPVARAWQAGDFDTMERLHTQYSDFLHQRTTSGASKMGLFIDGLDLGDDATEDVLKRNIARTERWAQVHPGSPLGYVLHAQALMSYAQHFRGNGYADSVTPQAAAVYHEYIQRAARYLLEHQAVASRTTSWHTTMLVLGRDEGWAAQDMTRIFEDGIAKEPADYRLYAYMSNALLPKWQGSTQQLDAFIRDAARRAPPAYGMELYARLYSGAEQEQYHRLLYAQSLVDWSLMKIGLQAWVNHFPSSWNKNIFAYQACIAGDKQAAKALLDEIAGRPEWEIWTPNAQVTFNGCVRWAADPKAEPTSPPSRDSASRRDAALPAVMSARDAT